MILMALQEFLQLCGLSENPFGKKFQKTLYPHSTNDLDTLYAKVDGFRNSLPEINDWFESQDELPYREPWVFFIHGRHSSGRRSILNYLRFHIEQLYNQLDRSNGQEWKSLVVIVKAKDDHLIFPVIEALKELRLEIVNRGEPDLGTELSQDIKKYVLDAKDPAGKGMYEDICQRISISCKSVSLIPVIALEEPRGFNQVEKFISILKFIPALFLMSENKDILKYYKPANDEEVYTGIPLELSDVTPIDVDELVRHRWRQMGGSIPPIIQPSVIGPVFSENELALGQAIKILAEALKATAEKWDRQGRPNQPIEVDLKTLQARALAVLSRLLKRAGGR